MSYINKPGKTPTWRKHVLNNLVADAILYEKIETSLSLARHKAKNDLTKLLARLITWAKKAQQKPEAQSHFHNLALRYLASKKDVEIKREKKKIKVLDKLFNDLGSRYQDRPGGYSRIIKLNCRLGDNNQRVIFSLV